MPVYRYSTKTKGSRWFFKVCFKGRQYLRRGYATRDLARRAEASFVLRYRPDKEIVTWQGLLDSYSSWYSSKVKRSTFVSFCSKRKNYLDLISDVDVNSLTFSVFSDWFSSLSVSRQTLMSVRVCLRSVLVYLRDFFSLDIVSFCGRLIVPKDYSIHMPSSKPFLSLDDFMRLDAATASDRQSCLMYRLAFVCGLRIGELLGLQVSSFFPDDGLLLINRQACDHLGVGKTVIVSPKTEKSTRWCILPDVLVVQLRDYIARNSLASDSFLFPGRKKGFPLGANTARRRLRKYIADAGLFPFSFHAFRRSEASFLNDSGVSGSVIRDFMGHDSEETARKYYIGDSSAKKAELRKVLNYTFGKRFSD